MAVPNENLALMWDRITTYSMAACGGIFVFHWAVTVDVSVIRTEFIESEEFKLFLEYMFVVTVIASSVAVALMVLGFKMSRISRKRGERDNGL